ncbi:hypothetical protein [Agitococcus lubricus]|uniref:Heme oxygenase n=1 Tax=Agitococcus lubricus TaxID=1077255 RepID=A0A2T5IRW8_9GAMM|nr:hypothetical protein [Agitococcus lubricus]PTQ86564.1 hypothetical protein C8N29_1371 [Agitococcus lubricus]
MGFKLLPYSDWLSTDLAHLHEKPLNYHYQTHYVPHTEAEILGCLYVILGSSMGSRRIANALQNHSDTTIQKIDFFTKVAENSSGFKYILNQIELSISNTQQQQDCINAAKSTFTIFIDSFDLVNPLQKIESAVF